jgi:hypothetical protein
MKKRLKELRRRLPAMALAAVMCMGTVVSAFAASSGPIVNGTEDQPAVAAITKKLTMPENTTIPDATFTFHFSPVSVDDVPVSDPTTSVLNDVTIVFSSSDSHTLDSSTNTINVIKQSSNLFSGVTFPHAGKYEYTVTEEQSVVETVDDGEDYTFSQAEYTFVVYVANGVNGLYVKGISSKIEVADSSNEDAAVGDKVDPTPDGDPDVEGDYSKMIFTNIYTKTVNTDPEDPTISKVLTIGKNVTGDYADHSKYFPFDVKVNKPYIMPDPSDGSVKYVAYVVDGSGNKVTSTDNYGDLASENVDSDGKAFIEFTAGDPLLIWLKHDQTLVFTNLTIGANYSVMERAVPNYKPSYVLVKNGGNPESDGNDEFNSDLLVDELDSDLNSVGILIGGNENSVAFTNEYQDVEPMGVIVSNLPYVMILILAVGSFMAFVVVKSRKKHSRA